MAGLVQVRPAHDADTNEAIKAALISTATGSHHRALTLRGGRTGLACDGAPKKNDCRNDTVFGVTTLRRLGCDADATSGCSPLPSGVGSIPPRSLLTAASGRLSRPYTSRRT